MTTQFTHNPIKLEDAAENVTEIQSYLAGFQKEIGSDAPIQQVSGMNSKLNSNFIIIIDSGGAC